MSTTAAEQSEAPLPFKPKDWVAKIGDHGSIAQVKHVCRWEGEVFLDLVLYSPDGDKIGRESPAMGGPRTFEPMCDASGWERISEPSFPVQVQWAPRKDGVLTLRLYAGPALPPANYVPRRRKPVTLKPVKDEALREALRKIADGHNDPRALAKAVLGL